MTVRTDLALEAREMVRGQAEKLEEIPGVIADEFQEDGVCVTRVTVEEQAQEVLGKPAGVYITIETSPLLFEDPASCERITTIFSRELSGLWGKPSGSTLVVGLGNRAITADALGPFTVERMLITRHLKNEVPVFEKLPVSSVCALSPGVLGMTGIETAEIVRGAVVHVKPERVLLIDALAARKMNRVNTTIQLSDTGIQPGAGVGNHRLPMTRETLGVPVFSVGVPTVVDAATIASDVMEHFCRQVPDSFADFFAKMEERERYAVLREVLGGDTQNPVVTPKDTDARIELLSGILSDGISMALHPQLSLAEIHALTRF